MLCDLASQEDLLLFFTESEWPETAHAVFANHFARHLSGTLNVVSGPGRHLFEEDLFSDASAHENGKLRLKVILGYGVLVVFRQLHGDAESHSTRDNGYLMKRIRMVAYAGHQRVAGFVIGGNPLLLVGQQHGL